MSDKPESSRKASRAGSSNKSPGGSRNKKPFNFVYEPSNPLGFLDDDDESVEKEDFVIPAKKRRGGPKKLGRRKIPTEYIEDKNRRHVTFSKRKSGIMKKAFELSTLTGTQLLLLIASETGHVYTYATNKLRSLITDQAGKDLIQDALNSPEEGEIYPEQIGDENYIFDQAYASVYGRPAVFAGHSGYGTKGIPGYYGGYGEQEPQYAYPEYGFPIADAHSIPRSLKKSKTASSKRNRSRSPSLAPSSRKGTKRAKSPETPKSSSKSRKTKRHSSPVATPQSSGLKREASQSAKQRKKAKL